MSFRKYDSIENAYRESYIRGACEKDQTLRRCNYILQEKVHGANISFLFKWNEPIRVFSRNYELDITSNKFYGLADILKTDRMVRFLESVKRASLHNEIRLYGELFGGNVQKGVNYGSEKRILFYDMMMDGEFIAITSMIDFMMSMDRVEDWFVPIIHRTLNLQEALDFDMRSNTHLHVGDEPNTNIMEGVVIKPYFDVKTDQYGRIFYIKNKNTEFLEKSKAKKSKPRIDLDPEVQFLQSEFNSYLTENRLDNLFSKLGFIEDMDQIGTYISEFHKDALEDFLKDFGDIFDVLAIKDQRLVTRGTGAIVVPMLKGRM